MKILDLVSQKITEVLLSEKGNADLENIPNELNCMGYDNWGMNRDSVAVALRFVKYLYKYFRVETEGIENIPSGRVLLVANHSGQLPIDGALIYYAMATQAQPPRIARAMYERFVPRVPFISTMMSRCGHVIGDPINCKKLLLNNEAVLVFPEGAKGSGKLYWQRYKLQKFGTGFMRLALETQTPIIPVSVVGAEEIYPALYNFKFLAKLLKLPYFPITPTWPLLGPLGAVPYPSKVSLHFGSPLIFEGDFDGTEEHINELVDVVVRKIQTKITNVLETRA
ncbi:lysophospholipid acyltransferase family protein [Candidatus Uabimicrobium sp. HlEnr_7]|uniref:lysophospholipid acyltransferase family protein n=1 Tax=Candidatus Uabimicrobium helgolandensis TaxID=3095367 RepID=UPI003558D2A3